MSHRRWDDPDAGWWDRLRRRFYRAYYRLKYLPFAQERRAHRGDEGRGFVGIQIDALAFEDFERALDDGHMPFLRRLVERDGWDLRRYPAGLPSATPAAQASIFHGQKDRIPAFRFYEKKDRRVIIGSQTSSMQYIRDRLPERGVLSGGSSYVNLYDGGADRAVWTLSDRNRRPFLENLGGGRMLLLLLLHPIRAVRMVLVGILEYLRDCARRFDVLRHTRLSCELLDATWVAEQQPWELETSGEPLEPPTGAVPDDLPMVVARIEAMGLKAHVIVGTERTVVAAIGEVTARMGRALRGFFHPAAGRAIEWDQKHLPVLARHADLVTDPIGSTLPSRVPTRPAPSVT